LLINQLPAARGVAPQKADCSVSKKVSDSDARIFYARLGKKLLARAECHESLAIRGS
jgi:hypothetical protein